MKITGLLIPVVFAPMLVDAARLWDNSKPSVLFGVGYLTVFIIPSFLLLIDWTMQNKRSRVLCFITFAVLLFPNIVGGLIFIGQGFYRTISRDGTVQVQRAWRNNRSCCEPYEKIGCSTCFYEVLIDPQEEGYAEKKAIDDWELWMPRRDNRSRCDSNGVYIVSAEIRAFTANIPVKLGNRNAKPPVYDCGGYIDIDGDEDSQEAQPIWWDSHISSILKLASYKWRCCGPGQSETILRTPMENF